MGSFLKAKREHRTVMKAATENANLAADLWNALLGLGAAPAQGSFAEAVQDTVPVEHMALLATDDVAVAYAFDLMWSWTQNPRPNATPFELRDIAREGWKAFHEQAEKTEHIASGFGWSV